MPGRRVQRAAVVAWVGGGQDVSQSAGKLVPVPVRETFFALVGQDLSYTDEYIDGVSNGPAIAVNNSPPAVADGEDRVFMQ